MIRCQRDKNWPWPSSPRLCQLFMLSEQIKSRMFRISDSNMIWLWSTCLRLDTSDHISLQKCPRMFGKQYTKNVWYMYTASQMPITKNLLGNWSAGLRQLGDSTKRPAGAKAIEAKVKNLFCEDSSHRLPPQSLCKPTRPTLNQIVTWSGLHLNLKIFVFVFVNILSLIWEPGPLFWWYDRISF